MIAEDRPRPIFWPGLVACAAAALLLGQVPGSIAFAVNPDAVDDIGLSAVPLPAGVFIAVWVVIYAGMGVAGYLLWREARAVSAPIVVLVLGFLQTWVFWLSDGLRAVLMSDVSGVLVSVAVTIVVSRASWAAALWCLPWLTWMPATLVIKLVIVAG